MTAGGEKCKLKGKEKIWKREYIGFSMYSFEVNELIKEIITEVFPWEHRTAVLEDGKLVEVFRAETPSEVGTVFKGKIQKVLPGLKCAFVDIGQERNAILYFSDVIQKNAFTGISLKKGQDVLVQMVKQASGEKGARITEEITLPGRFLVLMPFRDELRVSRKIEGQALRQQIRELMAGLLPPSMGAILRTACLDASAEEIEAETRYLLEKWHSIAEKAESGRVPAIVCREADENERALREYVDGDTRRIWVNDEEFYHTIQKSVQLLKPEARPQIILKEGAVFESLGLNKEIRRTAGRKVWLKSGGFLIFDQTEAMMVVDVNSGKFTGKDDFEQTASRVNIEAAREIPRQLRLRGVGGMILIDFIDMQLKESQRKVIEALTEELKKDKEHTRVLGFTSLGLLEMTRKKTRRASLEQFTSECSICGGAGRVISLESCAVNLKNDLISSKYLEGKTLVCKIHPDLAEEMNKDTETLTYLKRHLQKEIVWEEDRLRKWADYEIYSR